jgi:hypothetical protein
MSKINETNFKVLRSENRLQFRIQGKKFEVRRSKFNDKEWEALHSETITIVDMITMVRDKHQKGHLFPLDYFNDLLSTRDVPKALKYVVKEYLDIKSTGKTETSEPEPKPEPKSQPIIEEKPSTSNINSKTETNLVSVEEYEPQKMSKENKQKWLAKIRNPSNGQTEEIRKLYQKVTEPQEENYFDCETYCRNFRSCTSNAMNDLGEIKANSCYISAYPYKWKTPQGKYVRVCMFMYFPHNDPNDPDNPCPQCLNNKPEIDLTPKEKQCIGDPQKCWTCVKIRKQNRIKQQNEQYKKKQEQITKMKEREYREQNRSYDDGCYVGGHVYTGSWFDVWGHT